MKFPVVRIASCALLLVHLAAGQICPPGEVRVFVKDGQDAPIFDSTVTMRSGQQAAGPKVTQTSGIADFKNVPCGSWTVHASKAGFEDAETTVQVTASGAAQVSLNLELKIVHSSVEVNEKSPPLEQSATVGSTLHPAEVKTLPSNPATVSDALPLVPGVVRAPGGELKIDGTGEQRSTLVVNQSDVTDPATGKFGQTLPIDAVETMAVLNTPFLAQYGRFTQSVVAVETKRGGDKWHFDLNDPFPDFRIRSYHMRGIRNETPRASAGGPLIANRLYLISSLTYILDKIPSRTLGFPHNESKQESLNSFTQVDYVLSPSQIVNATIHFSPQHTNFINPDFFHPQTATPSYAQTTYIGTAAHHWGLLGGTLDSSLSIQRFDTAVGAQGDREMVLTPEVIGGNFFGAQHREARRTEWLEIWSPAPLALGATGSHLFKIGTSLTNSGNQGTFNYRPVEIADLNGKVLQRVDFLNAAPFNRTDQELTAYAQDHWNLNPKLALDYGVRLEHQQLASSYRYAPRAGLAWTPFSNSKTVVRAGYGQFYDHIPLDVYTFGRYPTRVITNYAPDGSVLGGPLTFTNVIGSITGPKSFLIHGQRVAGSFSPRGATWNAQVEHKFARLLQLRAIFTDNKSVGLIDFEPALLGNSNEIVLNGDGSSRYRQLELTARVAWSQTGNLVFSYTRSRARGTLNEFDNFLGNYPTALVRPNLYSNLPGDLPNRFLMWGRLQTGVWKLWLLPIVEYRDGFPYAAYDLLQQYAGTPFGDRTRFPQFFSADSRLMRDFQVSQKYTLRLSVTGFNLTNHFNPLTVYSNIASPQFGEFFGNYHRRYRFDFEVVF